MQPQLLISTERSKKLVTSIVRPRVYVSSLLSDGKGWGRVATVAQKPYILQAAQVNVKPEETVTRSLLIVQDKMRPGESDNDNNPSHHIERNAP